MSIDTLYDRLPAQATTTPRGWAELCRRLRAWRSRLAEQRHLNRAERALAEMSLNGLRDVGAPEPLLQRRHLQDQARRLAQRARSQPPG